MKKTERQLKKSAAEKGRRDRERHHLERISRLFKAPEQHWAKKDVLGLGKIIFLIDGRGQSLTKFVPAVIFLLYGSEAFPPSCVEVRSIQLGL